MLQTNPQPFVLAIALSLFAGHPVDAVASSSNPNPGAKQVLSGAASQNQMSVERTVDATNFISDMADAANALKCYTFAYQTTVFKGSKVINQAGSFWFKQLRQIRVDMTGDYKRGAVAVLGSNGKVRGHLGGALGAFTVTLAPNSDMLLGANGYPLVDSDFAGMSAVVKTFLQQGCKAKVTEHPVSVEGQTKKVYVLEIYRPQSTELYKRTYVDPKTLLPLEWFDYQSGRLYAHTVWKDLVLDANIKDDVFKI